MATIHTCAFCGAEFKRKRKWYEHELVCELIHQSRAAPPDDPEDPITMDTLYGVLKEIIKHQQAMERDIRELQRHQQKVKISMTDWLTQNLTPTLSFKSLLKTLSRADMTDVDYLFKHSMVDTLTYIICRNLAQYKQRNPAQSDWPIFAGTINTQEKIFYYDSATRRWSEAPTLCATIWELINDNLLTYLIEWKQANLAATDDDKEISFNLTLLKLVGKTREEANIRAIKTAIFNKIKTPINTTTYQFT